MRTIALKPSVLLLLVGSIVSVTMVYMYSKADSVKAEKRISRQNYKQKNIANVVKVKTTQYNLDEISLNEVDIINIKKPTHNSRLDYFPSNKEHLKSKEHIVKTVIHAKIPKQNDRVKSKGLPKLKDNLIRKSKESLKPKDNKNQLKQKLNKLKKSKNSKIHSIKSKIRLTPKDLLKTKENRKNKALKKKKRKHQVVINHDTIKKNGKTKNRGIKSQIPIYIFEEHHEALHYWFGAMKNKTIPSSGNILIHIDGHSDLASPTLNNDTPYFRSPANLDEVASLAQGNDVFIIGAMICNLINSMAYVHPSWDTTDKDTPFKETVDKGFNSGIVRIGVLKTERKLCMCLEEVKAGNVSISCNTQNEESNSPQEDTSWIDNKMCKIKLKVKGFEILDSVAESLISKVYSGGKQSLILDIDEDYFGVELPGGVLNSTGADFRALMEMSQTSAALVCNVINLKDEKLVNFMFRSVVSELLQFCAANRCKLADAIRIVEKLRVDKRYHYLFCGYEGKPKIWRQFAESLAALRPSDLRLVLLEGWCAEVPLRFLKTGCSVRFCVGHNTPDQVSIALFTPSDRDIDQRARQLAGLLRRIHAIGPPAIVTLCRSSKDGYTPRHLQRRIEAAILKAFSDISDAYAVHYDEFLWGGSRGWSDRNKLD